LGDPDFAQFLQEGAGDVDVRFNREDGEERWYVQVKNYAMTPSTARKVFSQFRDTDAGTSGTYTRFTLACPGLNDDLKRLRAAVEELRGAASFYRPGQDEILDNTRADLQGLVEKIDLPVDADFLEKRIYFDTDLAGLTDDESLCNLFVGRLLRLDAWAWVAPDAAAHVYEKLALLCHRALRQTCSREQMEAIIREAVGEAVASISDIRELIVRDPVDGAKALSDYLATWPEWAAKRSEVDLKRADLERIQHDLDLFGPNPSDQAAKGRAVHFLLQVCLELE